MNELAAIAEALLDETAPRAALDDAAAALYALCASIAPVPATSDAALPSGCALSPSSAAACARDGLRTALFLRAVHDAIARRPGERLEVVYAGTGPFAPLALPLLARVDAAFTLIDVHGESVRSVETLLAHFGLTATTLVADATTYRHPVPIDVAVAEVMQRALGREPQVAIARNLRAQLREGGVLVPKNVVVDLVLADPQEAIAPGYPRIAVGTVADLVTTGIRTVTVPAIPPRAGAMYATTVHIDDRRVLREFDSGLTLPEVVWDLGVREGERIAFRYELGAQPGIRWERHRKELAR